MNIKILAIRWRFIGRIMQNFFPIIKYKIFPLLRQNFFPKGAYFLFSKIFYQYLSDKIYNNKYLFHQTPGHFSPRNCQIMAKLSIFFKYCNDVANILGNFLNKTEGISGGHVVPPPKN
jgi:hypothetical protein